MHPDGRGIDPTRAVALLDDARAGTTAEPNVQRQPRFVIIAASIRLRQSARRRGPGSEVLDCSWRSWVGCPEAVDRGAVQTVVGLVGVSAGVEHDPGCEVVPDEGPKRTEAAQVFGSYPGAGFDFEAGEAAITGFEHEVDFLAVSGAPMAGAGVILGPAGLGEDFVDHEGLEQVSELGHRGRALPGQLFGGDVL